MSILNAIFKYKEEDGEYFEELISVADIEKHPEFDKVRNHLFCTFENCECKLQYSSEGKKKAHFKTWPKKNHTKECIDYFEREEKARAERNSVTVNAELSDKRIANILNDIKRKRKEAENKGEPKANKPKTKKEKKNPTVDPSLPTDTGNVVINPVVGGNTGLQESDVNGKSKSVRKRTLTLLNESDIGYTRALWDVTIDSVDVNEKRVVLKVSNRRKSCLIYLEEAFFVNSPVNFVDRLKGLSDVVNKDKSVYFSCVGSVEKREGEVCMIVDKHSSFRVEDVPLLNFLHNYNS